MVLFINHSSPLSIEPQIAHGEIPVTIIFLNCPFMISGLPPFSLENVWPLFFCCQPLPYHSHLQACLPPADMQSSVCQPESDNTIITDL